MPRLALSSEPPPPRARAPRFRRSLQRAQAAPLAGSRPAGSDRSRTLRRRLIRPEATQPPQRTHPRIQLRGVADFPNPTRLAPLAQLRSGDHDEPERTGTLVTSHHQPPRSATSGTTGRPSTRPSASSHTNQRRNYAEPRGGKRRKSAMSTLASRRGGSIKMRCGGTPSAQAC